MDQKIIDKVFLNSNIIDEEEAKQKIKDTLSKIAKEVSKSLGPYGSTTIIEERLGDHYMTKDGYTILKAMEYKYDISRTILDIVKKISRSLVRTVGDGSTSSVLIANTLFNSIEDVSDKLKLAPQDIIEIYNVFSEIFEEYIMKFSNKITDENFKESITKIASISTNNDPDSGVLFAEIFEKIGKYGFINLENSKTNKDSYEIVQGIEVNRGYINQRMANMNDKISFEYENCVVFMCNDMISDDEMEFLAKLADLFALKKNVPVIIIAANYTSSVKAFFDSNLQKNKHLPIVAIDIDCSTQKGREKFGDLALALGCKYYDKFNGFDNIEDYDISDLGICKKVKGNDLHCMFIDGNGYETNKELIDEHIEELKKEYERLSIADDQVDREKDLFHIKKRIATLTKSMATLYVGGNSEMEKKTRHFLMEDAVYACRSSIEYGYVVGGNLVLPKVIHIFKDDIIDKVMKHSKLNYLKNLFTTEDELKNAMYLVINEIYNAFLICFKVVLQNARIPDKEIEKIIDSCINDNLIYNVKLRRYENDKDTIVINSAETDIEIIKASFSIIGLLATSNQFITTNPIYQN